jgi:hypothetical protein
MRRNAVATAVADAVADAVCADVKRLTSAQLADCLGRCIA